VGLGAGPVVSLELDQWAVDSAAAQRQQLVPPRLGVVPWQREVGLERQVRRAACQVVVLEPEQVAAGKGLAQELEPAMQQRAGEREAEQEQKALGAAC
jgi:hypothetical protein